MWIQSLWAIDTDEHIVVSMLYTKYLLLIFLIYSIVDDEKKLLYLSAAHVLGCFYLGWLAYETGGRVDGVGGPGIDSSNQLSAHLGTGIIFGAMLLMSSLKYLRFLAFIALPFILNGIILTGSRGGFLALLAGGIVFMWLLPKSKMSKLLIYSLLGSVLFVSLVDERFINRLGTILVEEDEQRDISAESRLPIMMSQWEIFKLHPLGVGAEGTKALSWQYLDEIYLGANGRRSSHNTYMSVLVDQGIPGFILYLLFLLTIYRLLIKLKKLDSEDTTEDIKLIRAAGGGGIAVIAIAGMFTDNFKTEVMIWCVSILLVLEGITGKKKQPENVFRENEQQRYQSKSENI
jgi:O-antigen ligase